MAIESGTTEPRSRRTILAGALGGVAGLIGSRFVSPDRANAAAGGPVIMGVANDAGTTEHLAGDRQHRHRHAGDPERHGHRVAGLGCRRGIDRRLLHRQQRHGHRGVPRQNNGAASGAGALRASGGNNHGVGPPRPGRRRQGDQQRDQRHRHLWPDDEHNRSLASVSGARPKARPVRACSALRRPRRAPQWRRRPPATASSGRRWPAPSAMEPRCSPTAAKIMASSPRRTTRPPTPSRRSTAAQGTASWGSRLARSPHSGPVSEA